MAVIGRLRSGSKELAIGFTVLEDFLNDALKKWIASEDRSCLVGDRIPRNDDSNHVDIGSSKGCCLQTGIIRRKLEKKG
jgi:hypothetical protein